MTIDHRALAADLLAGYSLLTEQGGLQSAHDHLRHLCLHLGYHLEHICKRQLGVRRFTAEQFARVAVELVRAFGGECDAVTGSARPIVLRAARWEVPPEAAEGPHPSCLIPDILAAIAARNFGYGKVATSRLPGFAGEPGQGLPGGGIEFRAYLKATRHAQADTGVESMPDDLPDPAELEHELLHQFERVRALRRALEQNEQRLTDLVTRAPDGIFILDPHAACAYANDGAAHLLGYPSGALRGLSLSDLVAAESAQTVAAQFDGALEGQATPLFRADLVSRSGDTRCVSLRLWPQRRNGDIVGVVALARDVTEREADERALRRSEALHRAVVEMSPDAIFMLDAQGKITFVNRRAWEAMDSTRDELVGAHFGSVLAPESRQAGQAAFLHAIRPDADPAAYHLVLVGKAGHRLHADISVSQVREKGEVTGLLGIARDVTHRREIEDELFHQHRALWALNAIANAVSRSLDLQHTLEDALDKTLEVTPFEGGAVYLLKGDWLRLTAARGFLADAAAGRIPDLRVGEGVSASVLMTGEPAVVTSHSQPQGPAAEVLRDLDVRTYAAVPLVAHKQVVGVMGLGAREPVKVSQDLLDLLVGIGSQVGMAIQNARLFEQTQHQARTDFLTGLYSRQYLQELLDREIARARRYGHSLAVLMLDVDGLKQINDAMGHALGDEVLRAVGGILRARLRSADIAGRYGGDEFVVIMPETDLPGAQRAADRLAHDVEVFNQSRRLPTHLGLSIGVAATESQFDRLLEQADRAMYAHRNRKARPTPAPAAP